MTILNISERKEDEMRRLVLIAAVASVVVVSATSATAASRPASEQAWQYRWQVWLPPVWQRIARCESGQWPPNWRHDSGTYTGAFGFHIGSWLAYRYAGYPARASQATPWQQYRVALRIHSKFGFSGWGCYDHQWVRG
jgi:hypothetical protein